MISTNIFTGTREDVKSQTSTQIDEEVRLTNDLFTSYLSQKSLWAKHFKENNEFRHGIQWTKDQIDTLKERNQSASVINVIQPSVEQAVALLTASKPRFHSTAREESDLRTASVFSDIMSYIWEHSDGNIELKKIVDDYYVGGMGVMQVYYDPYKDMGKGDICIKSLDPLDVYFDPNSKDVFCRDSAHVIIAKIFSREQVLSTWPNMMNTIDSAKTTSMSNDISTGRYTTGLNLDRVSDKQSYLYDVIERYTKVRIQRIRVDNRGDEYLFDQEQFERFFKQPAFKMTASGGEVNWATKRDEVAYYGDLYDKGQGKYHVQLDQETQQPALVPGPVTEEGIPGSEVDIELLTISHAIEEKVIVVESTLEPRIKRVMSVGDVLLYNDILEIEDYPVIPFMNHHSRTPYPMSDIYYVKNDQEFINKIRSLIIAHASNSTNSKWWVPRGSANINELQEGFQKSGAFIGEYDAELGIPQQANPTPLPSALYKLEGDVRRDIQERLGIYPFMQGDSSQAPPTYKGTMALDEFGQRRIRSKREDIESALTHVARIVVQYIQLYFTEPRIFRLLMPNNTSKDVLINMPPHEKKLADVISKINDVTKGRYDIILVSGSTLPSNRWARFEYYMELYKNGIIDQIEVLKQTDVVDVEGVLERRNQVMEMQGMIKQQQEEIKKLSGDLQTAHREGVQDRKRVEVEKFKTKLSTAGNRADFATTLYQARLNDRMSMTQMPDQEPQSPDIEILDSEE